MSRPLAHELIRSLLVAIALSWLAGCFVATDDAPVGVETEEDVSAVAQALTAPGWQDLGGNVSDISISSQTALRFDVWAIGAGSVWHQVVQNGCSSGWENSAGKPTGKTLTGVAAAYRGSSNACTDVVATDTTGKIWVNTWCDGTFSWTGWTSVGAVPGTAVGKPAVSTVVSDNRLDVWVRGTNNSLWHAWRFGTTPWSGWFDETAPSGGLTSAPAAVTRQQSPLVLDVVAVGTSSRLWHRTWSNNQWSSWVDRGPVPAFQDGPTVASNGPGQLIILGQSSSTYALQQKSLTNGVWSGFTTIGPPTLSPIQGPEARYVNGRLEILITGNAGNVWRKSHSPTPEAEVIVGYLGKCANVDSILTPSGNPRVTWRKCDRSLRQAWVKEGEAFRSLYNYELLTVENAATGNGSSVITYPCSGTSTPGSNARWTVPFSAQAFQIKGVASSRCVLPGGFPNPAEGTGLIIWDCLGLPWDRWYLPNNSVKQVKVKVFAMQDDAAGTNGPTLTRAQLRNILAEASEVHLRSGIRFELVSDSDWVVQTNADLNGDWPAGGVDEDAQARALAAANLGFATLILRNGGTGGFSMHGAQNDYVVLPNDPFSQALFSHEIGHYIGLDHTMWDALYDKPCAEQVPGVECHNTKAWSIYVSSGLNADGLVDTADDPGPWVFERRAGQAVTPKVLPGIAWDHCGGSDTISIFNPSNPSITASFVVDRRNVMSYFKECWTSGHDMSIVPQQIGKVKAMLTGPYRAHLFP